MMETHATVGLIGRLAARGSYRADLGGAIVILALATGSALGFGAVVDRLTTSATVAPASIAGASEVQLILTAPHVGNGGQDVPGAVTDSSLANVFDGWYYDAPSVTPSTYAWPQPWPPT
jgi:hypothetical protein